MSKYILEFLTVCDDNPIVIYLNQWDINLGFVEECVKAGDPVTAFWDILGENAPELFEKLHASMIYWESIHLYDESGKDLLEMGASK